MNDKNIQLLQAEEFRMLLVIKDICQKYDLQYYLGMGTLLGAVKYQKMIPWDDDIDVLMPRESYMKFIQVVDHEELEGMCFKSYNNDPDYKHPVARMLSKRIFVVNYGYQQERVESAWIDIFPLDGIPDSRILYLLHKTHLLWRKVTIGWANYRDLQYRKKGRPWYEKILMSFGKVTKIGRFLNLRDQYAKLEKTLMKYPAEQSRYFLNFNSTFRFKNCFDKKKIYGDGDSYFLWDEEFIGPSNYQVYLNTLFGDYTKTPPEGDRNRHMTKVFIPEDFEP